MDIGEGLERMDGRGREQGPIPVGRIADVRSHIQNHFDRPAIQQPPLIAVGIVTPLLRSLASKLVAEPVEHRRHCLLDSPWHHS